VARVALVAAALAALGAASWAAHQRAVAARGGEQVVCWRDDSGSGAHILFCDRVRAIPVPL